jgi:REP-associated tyrosine transposase
VPQSLAQVLVHLIFSTKNREPFLSDDVRPELHPYMATILKGNECPAILINSVEDHAHVLFHLSKNRVLCDVIESLKKDSSKWIKTKGRPDRNFHWQSGYGAFSVSQSNVAQVIRYIESRKNTIEGVHFKRSFVRSWNDTRCLMTNGMCGTKRVVCGPAW